MNLFRRIPVLLCTVLAGLGSARADNLPPELHTPLPVDLTLEPGSTPVTLNLAQHLRDPDVPGTAVRLSARLGSETRTIDLALFDTQAPATVTNFLAYIADGRYAANFFHRSVPGFVIQNGGFYFQNDTTFDYVPTYDPVVNEPGISNLRGTVAMAKLGGDPDSATSQWFINLADNSANLDAQNGGFTVFGRVLGEGMAVADALAAVPTYNGSSIASAWNEIPLANYAGNLTRANFIETSAAVIPALTTTIQSSAPDTVSASISNGVLTLTPSATQPGTATLTLTTTDLDGAQIVSSFDVTVSKLPQAITLPSIPDHEYGDAPFALDAITSSGLPVTVEVTSGPATYADGLLTITDIGTITIRASQSGDTDYLPAESISRTFSVNPASQVTITLSDLNPYYTGSPLTPTVTTSPPGLTYTIRFFPDPNQPAVENPPDSSVIGTPNGPIETPTLPGSTEAEVFVQDSRAVGKFASAIFTIQRAPLTVRPVNAVRLPGQANPPFTLTYTHPTLGLIPSLNLSKTPVATTTATKSSPGGVYPITVSGGVGHYYTFNYEPGELTILGSFAGTYEGLLYNQIFEELSGKLTLTLPASGTKFTGRIDDEFNSTSITGSIAATENPLGIRGRARFKEERFLEFTIDDTHGLVASIIDYSAENPTEDPADPLSATFLHPARLAPFSSKTPAPWTGAYTLSLPVLSAKIYNAGLYPRGTGHAFATIDAKGVLKFTGTLADGVKVTASAFTDADGAYRIFARPYGTKIFSPFVGPLQLQPHPDTERSTVYHIPVNGDSRLYWSKGFPITKSRTEPYRGGFGPVELAVALDPWLPPAPAKKAAKTTEAQPATTLAQRLAVADTPDSTAAIGLDYVSTPEGAFSAAQIDGLPAAFTLATNNKPVLPAKADNPAKLALSLNPKTGAFSGSFVLTDTMNAPTTKNPDAKRTVIRKVPFSGTLRQPPSTESDAPIGHGHFLLPALPNAASPEQVSGELRLLAAPAP